MDDIHSGKIKWFSEDRGYGYLTSEYNEDYYFGVKNVIGAELPLNGDIITFTLYKGKDNLLSADNINIVERKNPALKKVKCQNCSRDVEPKPWFYGGSDYTNVNFNLLCPFCGFSIYKTGGGFTILAKMTLLFFVISFSYIYLALF